MVVNVVIVIIDMKVLGPILVEVSQLSLDLWCRQSRLITISIVVVIVIKEVVNKLARALIPHNKRFLSVRSATSLSHHETALIVWRLLLLLLLHIICSYEIVFLAPE
jgi:hypothetical protein